MLCPADAVSCDVVNDVYCQCQKYEIWAMCAAFQEPNELHTEIVWSESNVCLGE